MRRRLPFLVVALLLVVLGVLLYVGAIELPTQVARTTHVLFNHAEAVIWGIAGICVFWRSRKHPAAHRTVGSVACVAFFAFGVSDVIETRTSTWYDPWWLFAWKAACVLILLSCLLFHARSNRRGAGP